MPKCAVCKKQFKKTYSTLQKVCSTRCAIDLAKNKKLAKLYGNGAGRKKGKFNAISGNDIHTRRRAAREACHRYIRERDKEKPCICCGGALGDNYQAGHFIPSGQNPLCRYDEDNIHGQRLDCNYFRGGDSGKYRGNLIKRIGEQRVERLESMKGGTMKRTAEDYREIEQYYKQKLKDLIALQST